MPELRFEDAYPMALNLARKKISAAIRRGELGPADAEDVQQQLLLVLWRRFSQFDPRRAGLRTFISRVMDRALSSVLRLRRKQARRREAYILLAYGSADRGVFPGDGCCLIPRRQELQLDLERVLGSLPVVLRETAHGLCSHTPRELVLSGNRSRTVVYGRIRQLRQALMKAGIDRDYFAATGGTR